MKHFLVSIIVLLWCSITAIAQTATPPSNFSESDAGTGSNPYQIATLDNLSWLSQNSTYWSSSFIQTADIDASETSTWNSGAGFSPIGNNSIQFTGAYNGNGHTMSNVYISRSTTDYIGLFGYIGSGALVDSLTVGIDSIIGQNYVGGLAGYNTGTVRFCSITGVVTGSLSVGGFIGTNSGGTVSSSHSSAATSGSYDVAAFIGDNVNSGSINSCYATGNSNGGTSTGCYTSGGLVGWNEATISNCYATGSVTGLSPVGGLYNGKGTVTNSYAIGKVTGTNPGGLAGSCSGTVSNCFWNSDTVSAGCQNISGTFGATGKTTTELKTQSTFTNAGWDKTVWCMDANIHDSYPYFAWQYPGGTPIFPLGSGTSSDPYQIGNLSQLHWLSQITVYDTNYYAQTADINADSTRYWDSGSGFFPIGLSYGFFYGHYNGRGHTISGLYINRPSTNFIGLFCRVTRGSVDSLGLLADTVSGLLYTGGLTGICDTNASITNCYVVGSASGKQIIGGLAGSNSGGSTVRNCYAVGTVSGTSTMEGGLLGQTNRGSTTTGCYATCTVSGMQMVGGLVGDHSSSVISNCYATGNASSGTYGIAGGLVGQADNGAGGYSTVIQNCYATGTASTTGNTVGGLIGATVYKVTVTNCYARGAITGAGNVGGLIGVHDSSTVTCCYATGTVTGSVNVGGLVGYNKQHSTVDSCFWDMQTTGIDTCCGKNNTWSTFTATGNSTSLMKTQSSYINAGWDKTVWYMDASINDGYPYLAWQNPSGTPMPVEFASFTAIASSTNATLNWKTTTETNNYGFEVERRTVGQTSLSDWTELGFVAGTGTSNIAHSYSYTDNSVSSGTYAYRLKQIDNDGTSSYSSEAEVTISVPLVFALNQNYPNPFNPTTTISFTLAKDGYTTLKIFDVLGREITTLVNGTMKAGIVNSITFSASKLASGVYFSRLESSGSVQLKKLMVLK